MTKTNDELLAELKQKQSQYVRIAIYPAGTKLPGKLTYRNNPCEILPDSTGKFYTDYPDSRDEYNTEQYRVRWGRVWYLKNNKYPI